MYITWLALSCFSFSFLTTALISPAAMSDEQAPGPLKRLAFQFKKAVSNVEVAGLPKNIQDKTKECEQYRDALVEVCDAFLQLMIGDPKYTPPANSTQIVEYPPGESPAEQLEKSLADIKAEWYDENVVKEGIAMAKLYNMKQREYQKRGRSQIHIMRAFINNTFTERFADLKRDVMAAKDLMDIANDDLKKGENNNRKKTAKKATDKFDKELAKLEEFVGPTMDEYKRQHMEEIRSFFMETQNYSDWMATYHKTISVLRVRKPQ